MRGAQLVAALDALLVDHALLVVQEGDHQRHGGRPIVRQGAAKHLAVDGERLKAALADVVRQGEGGEVAGQVALEGACVERARSVRKRSDAARETVAEVQRPGELGVVAPPFSDGQQGRGAREHRHERQGKDGR